MGRARIWPPKIAHHKGRDRCWWNGHWWDLGPEGSPKSRAEHGRLLSIWATDPNAVPERPDDYLLGELFVDWMKSDGSPTNPDQRTVARRAAALLLEHHPETPVVEFGPVALRAWQSWLCRQVDAAGRPKWNRTYVGMLVRCVRQAFRWAVATERIEHGRYEALRTIAPPKFEECREPIPVQAVDPSVVAKTLPHLRPTVRAMVELQGLVGCRPEEICQLRPRDIHRNGRIEITNVGLVDLDELGVWIYLPERHKGRSRRKPRWLILGERAREVIAPYLERDPDAYCFVPGESLEDLRVEQKAERDARNGGSGGNRKRVSKGTANRPGPKYTPRTYRQAIARAAAKAGAPHWTSYQLRHQFAMTVDEKFGLDYAQASLGHSDPDTTRRYSKRNFQAAVDVARKMG